ncbi:MAG: glycosyltransferase family A protein [bacterium]
MSKGSNIKRIIKKKIELNSRGEKKVLNQKKEIQPRIVRKGENYKTKQQKDMTKFEQRIYASIGKKKTVQSLNEQKKKKNIPPVLIFKDFPPYKKRETVDYDVIIAICSFNRYKKVKRLLNQLLEQKSKYTFRIMLMNDGSTKGNYQEFKNYDIIYIENKINGGKNLYWKTVSTLWERAKNFETHAFLQIDDDFLLCENFIDTLMNKFFELKEKNSQYCGIRYHVRDYNRVIELYSKYDNDMQGGDGGTLFDIDFIKYINYNIPKQIVKNKLDHTHVWSHINDNIKEYGGRIYVCPQSLAYHDGNEDSKHHPIIRKKKKICTQQYVGNNLNQAFEKNEVYNK